MLDLSTDALGRVLAIGAAVILLRSSSCWLGVCRDSEPVKKNFTTRGYGLAIGGAQLLHLDPHDEGDRTRCFSGQKTLPARVPAGRNQYG